MHQEWSNASPLDKRYSFSIFLCAPCDILLPVPSVLCLFCLMELCGSPFGVLSQCAFVLCAFSALCVTANLRGNQPQAMLPPSQDSPRAIEGGGSADVILYVGLAMISLGLLITFLGLGEGTSGFKTMEMKLIGPSLVGCGVFFAVLRILFCTVSQP